MVQLFGCLKRSRRQRDPSSDQQALPELAENALTSLKNAALGINTKNWHVKLEPVVKVKAREDEFYLISVHMRETLETSHGSTEVLYFVLEFLLDIEKSRLYCLFHKGRCESDEAPLSEFSSFLTKACEHVRSWNFATT